MSFTFSIGYRTPISSMALNEKFYDVWGRNGVLDGFKISKHSASQVKIDSGTCVIKGVKVEYKEDNPGNPLKISIPLTSNGILYIYGVYNHKLSTFTIHTTSIKDEAQGEWRVFLGHVEITNNTLSIVQPIVEHSISELEGIYKQMPNLNEIINMFYESTIEINKQVNILMNEVIGDMPSLKTEHKDTVVGSINELYDTKEPTLTRDRIFQLIGGGSGGNIEISSINKIPIERFVLDNRSINTASNSGLIGGGNLTKDRNLQVDWGRGENQVPRGNHNHDGYHIEKMYNKTSGANINSAIYSQLAYYSTNQKDYGPMVIILPREYTGATVLIEIKGHDLSGDTSGYTLQVAGELVSSSKSWNLCSANILGDAPFSNVSFARHNSTGLPCVILGTERTAWNKCSLYIDKLVVNNDTYGSWDSGWTIKMLEHTEGTTIQNTPRLMTGGPQPGEFVPPARSISAGTGLTGGGSLNNDVSLSVNFGNSWSTVARGNHEHSQYLNKNVGSRNGIVVTDGSGNIKVDDLIWDYELRRLSGVRSNIQSQIDSKANNGHSHGDYFPRSGGQMGGAVNMAWHWFNTDNCHINGQKISISYNAPSPEGWGHVWIQLT